MHWRIDAVPHPTTEDPVATLIIPKPRDIGDFEVRRALPAVERRNVGPFVFLDQMGPVAFEADQAMDVRPHPHIGLATITWLFEGEIQHKDSLGYDVTIRPGEVNWMTAGSGIVHSERSPQSQRYAGARLAGIQAWVALPKAKEEMEPAFHHYEHSEIPRFDADGIRIALIAGSAYGQQSPVEVASPMVYAELLLAEGRELHIPVLAEESAIYLYSGRLEIAGKVYASGTLIVLKPETAAVIRALDSCCCMLLGGDSLDGPRHLYWNFVSSSRERLEQAKTDWLEGRFKLVDGDPEFIPLPGPAVPAYP